MSEYIKFNSKKSAKQDNTPATPATPATQQKRNDDKYMQNQEVNRADAVSQSGCDSLRLCATPATQDGTHRPESRQSRNESQRVAGASDKEGIPATPRNANTSANLSVQSRESRKSRKGSSPHIDFLPTVLPDTEGDTPEPAPLGKVGRHGAPCSVCGDTWQWPTSRGGWVCSWCICAAPGPVQMATPGGDIADAGD